jgi:hypothetical protein
MTSNCRTAMSTIKALVDDLLVDRQLTVAEAMDRHLSSAFRQRTNGRWENRDEVAARIAEARETFEHATITVLDELRDGSRYAERHAIDLVDRDGGHLALEVYVFAEIDADGRFGRIEEANFQR